MSESGLTWSYPRPFWIANCIELFERAAYYGMYIALALYLSRVVGFSDVAAGIIGAAFSALIYFLPFIVGAIADRMGFRPALALAFALLAAGYGTMGLLPYKGIVMLALFAVATGGAFVKPIISGTVSKYSDSKNRARAFSIFYMVVNIGSFSGKTIARPLRVELGTEYIMFYAAAAAFAAFLLVVLFYFPKEGGAEKPRSVSDTLRGMGRAMSNGRFLALILITAGFWIIQGQLYASMPKYVLRMVGEHASPEWYANVNPFVVVLCVVPVTHLVRRMPPVGSIGIGLGIIPVSALCMALSPQLGGSVELFGWALHPITVMMVLGIALQGLAECFLSPRYLEFASKQAPGGQEGLYLGYAHLNTFVAWLVGWIVSGYLLDAFCPDPRLLSEADQAQRLAALAGEATMPAAYAHAHYIWFVFFGIGVTAFVALLIFQAVTRRADRLQASERERP